MSERKKHADYSKLTHEQLISIIYEQTDMLSAQKAVVNTARARRVQSDEELKGAKVLLAYLVQKAGGKIEITDQEMQNFEFNLTILQKSEEAKTILTSRKANASGKITL